GLLLQAAIRIGRRGTEEAGGTLVVLHPIRERLARTRRLEDLRQGRTAECGRHSVQREDGGQGSTLQDARAPARLPIGLRGVGGRRADVRRAGPGGAVTLRRLAGGRDEGD